MAKSDAKKIAGHLAGLTSRSENKRLRDLSALRELLFAPGVWTDAGVDALPRLVEIAASAAPKAQRGAVLLLAADTYTAGHFNDVGAGLDGAIGEAFESGLGLRAAQIGASLRADIAALVGDDDARVRAAAALMLAFVSSEREASLAAIADQLATESSAPAAASLAIAYGLLARTTESPDWAPLERRLEDDDDLVRAATRIALLDHRDDGAESEALLLHGLIEDAEFTWCDGSADQLTFLRLLAVRGEDAAVEAMRRRVAEHVDHPRAGWWAFWALERRFEPAAELIVASDLDDAQRDLLAAISERELDTHFVRFGVPDSVAVRRRWLGLDPPTPIDAPMEVDGATVPAWQARLKLGLSDWVIAVRDQLAPAVRLGVVAETFDGVHRPVELPELEDAVRTTPSVRRLAWAEAFLDRFFEASTREDVESQRWVQSMRRVACSALGVVADHLPDGESLDASRLAAFTLHGTETARHNVAKVMPEAWVEAHVLKAMNDHPRRTDLSLQRIAPIVEYAQTPTVLERLAKILAEVTGPYAIKRAKVWLVPAADRHDAIAAILPDDWR
ncbi:MAG: hypothetical protein RMA76_16900 [Deltaproteobacteria bacterium]|jgi:HEAT repeat protein